MNLRIKWYYFFKMFFFALFMRFFWQKIGKFSKLEKFENMMESFFEKKPFSVFKRFPYKNGKAENTPVVAGRLVIIQIQFWGGTRGLRNFADF